MEQARGLHKLPFQFAAGIQRLRTNPVDGQVYAVGLSGWQGPAGGADGCLQRVRYTGADEVLLLGARVLEEGIELTFSGPLDRDAAVDLEAYSVRRWNYRWARGYGSEHYSVVDGERVGEDVLAVRRASLSGEGSRVLLELEDLSTCDQMAVTFDLRARGQSISEEVLMTVNSVPGPEPRIHERLESRDPVDLPWTVLEGGEGPGRGRHVVLIAGDEEYRSEECLPMLARILAEHHGFRCTVLYSIDPQRGTIDPMNQTFTPGLEVLAEADMLVLFTRFREWPDGDMQRFVEYVESGKPVLGIRTATHAFDYRGMTFTTVGEEKASQPARRRWQNRRGVRRDHGRAQPSGAQEA